jgi:hypothetical protein
LDEFNNPNVFDRCKYTDIETEYAIYSSEPTIGKDCNIFNWWRENLSRFPNLSLKSKMFLCVPPSSVASERVFSTAGNVIEEHRTRLLPEKAERLVFLKTNSKYFE